MNDDPTADDPRMAALRAVTVGAVEQREIVLTDHDPAWHHRFDAEAERITDHIGALALQIEHVGSTAVCGLAAKPIVDLLLVVADPADELAYLPALTAAGYVLRIREPDFFEHRMLRTADLAVHVHVFGPAAPEVARMLTLRDLLRTDAPARYRYERTKRTLAARSWPTMQHYADAKSDVIEDLLRHAAADEPVAAPTAVVLVEGASDRRALAVLARRRGLDLTAEGVAIVAMGGAGNAGRFLARYGPCGLYVTLAGLYDAAEVDEIRRGLARAGLGDGLDVAAMASLGFHRCVEDLEDELIRALGVAGAVQVVAAAGEATSLRTFQQQPAQRDRPMTAQLRRFIGTRSGRKLRYAGLLVDALDLGQVPAPLDAVLAHVTGRRR